MNGRIYDFNVGRFLSVDPFLQFPENSQSANPYSYILNNPMSGTDPTGYAATGGGCSTGSNTGFEGFCTSVQLADTESKKKSKATVGNGEANGKLTISGEAKRVGEVGIQLEKSGGKLVSGQTNLDGSATETYSFGEEEKLAGYDSSDPDTGKYSSASGDYITDQGEFLHLQASNTAGVSLMRDSQGRSYGVNLETGVAELAFGSENGSVVSVSPELYAIGGTGFFKGIFTTAKGFLIGGLTIRTPIAIPVQRFGAMSISGTDFWGVRIGTSLFANRYFAAIKPAWNPLAVYTTGVIPKGTQMTFGIIGAQGFRYGGGSLQFIVNSREVVSQTTRMVR